MSDQPTEATETPQEGATLQEGQPPQPGADAPQPPGDAAPDAQTQEGAQDADLRAQLDAMRAQIEDLHGRVSSGQLSAQPRDDELAGKVSQLREKYRNWPQKGSDLPQPWDFEQHDLPRPGVTRDYLPGGQPDELSPVVPAHGRPILTSGMGGSAVAELGEALCRLGYPNSISKGTNHTFHFDDSVAAAVATFGRDYGVKEDPSQFPPQHDPAGYVGPWLWEAILRAVEHEKEKRAA